MTDKQKKLIYDTRGIKGLEEFEKNGGGQDMFGRSNMPRGHNYQIEVKATLKELYLGTNKKVSLQRNEVCHECQGTGAHNGEVE